MNQPAKQESDAAEAGASGPVSVIIAEGEDLFRALLAAALSATANVEVAGVFPDAEAAIEATRRVHPKVVILDAELRGTMSGIEAGILIRRTFPDAGIIWLSSHKRPYLPVSFQHTTGWAYLLKTSGTDVRTLATAIDGVAQGLVVLDPGIANLMKRLLDAWIPRLSRLQYDVLALMAQSLSNAAIGRVLDLPERSIENQVNQIYGRLGLHQKSTAVHRRVEAVLAYIRAGGEDGDHFGVAVAQSPADRRLPNNASTAQQRSLPKVLEEPAFLERVQEEITRCLRTRRHFSVLLVIEPFADTPTTQDTNLRPDALLDVAQELARHVRGYDLVTFSGGDEVMLMFPEATREHADTILVRLRATTASLPGSVLGGSPRTWGLATWPADGTDLTALLDAARRRLFAA